MREVREEGGVSAHIIGDLGSINYVYWMNGRRYAKQVDFYLMEYESGNPSDHDHEVQEARWFPLGEGNRLAFPSEQALVAKARKLNPRGL